jgi:methionine-gamma-lyase
MKRDPAAGDGQAGDGGLGGVVPLAPPIVTSTTFVFENAAEVVAYNQGRSSTYLYSRNENPTVVGVERQLAAFDGAEAAALFGSGTAAAAAVFMSFVDAGDEVVCPAAGYGGTQHLLRDVLARYGVAVRFVALEELARPDRLLAERTRLVWFESPTNPTLRCTDIAAVAAICREGGVLSAFDNTFASPINQRPLALGVDLVMQSATKYLNGHSDVVAGVVAGGTELVARVARTRRLLGGILDPRAAAELGRGLMTLTLRITRQNASAGRIAAVLAADGRVGAVHYPGLASHPDHALAVRQMSGFGGMICLDLDGRYERAERFYDRLRLVRRAASLGGVESIVSLPVLTSHVGYSDEQLRAAGVTKGMVRLSVGLEDPEDLIADLDQALG